MALNEVLFSSALLKHKSSIYIREKFLAARFEPDVPTRSYPGNVS
jgi:hypothetical protein